MSPGKSTQAIQSKRDESFRSVVYPIYQSTVFAVEKSDDYEHFIAGDEGFHIYTRNSNPSIRNVEEKLARLEQGEDCVLFASGMAAITSTLLTFLKNGDAVAASQRLYGATYRFLRDVATQFGIDVHFLDDDELFEIQEYAPTVKVIYFETPINPTSDCVSIARVVEAAKKIGAITIIDNSFASPINQNPIPLGVDIVLHSATKYLGGHTDLMAGVAVGSKAHIKSIRQSMIVFGGCSNPMEASLLDRSLKTLSLRVEAQNRAALTLAKFFETENKVKKVHYPGLESSPSHEIAKSQMSGFGGMLAIELEDLNAAKKFCDSLKVALNATSLGSVETLVSIPVLSSHIRMNDEELAAARVTPGMVRISAGLEDMDDLIADFKQALAAT